MGTGPKRKRVNTCAAPEAQLRVRCLPPSAYGWINPSKFGVVAGQAESVCRVVLPGVCTALGFVK